MGIRENIVLLRKHFNITQEELAKVAGVSRGAVSQWEGGFSEPRMGAIQRMADYFGIAKSNIIEDDGMRSVDPDTGRIIPVIPSSGISPRKADGRPARIRVVPSIRVPLVGRVHAGDFEPEEELERWVEVGETIIESHPNARALQVEGHCMDRIIPEGSFVLYDPDDTHPANGAVVICETEDYSALMRRWYSTGRTLVLSPESFDPDITDIVLTWGEGPIKVLGVVFHCQKGL